MKPILSFPKGFYLLVLATLTIFASCKKNNTETTTTDPATINDAVQNDAVAEDQFNDVFNITMGPQASDAGEEIGIGTGAGIIYKPAGADGVLSPDSVSRCFTVTVTPKVARQFPKTVTIDFGNGCLGKDGKFRKGKIISVYSGPVFVAGNSVSTTFDNYYVDSFKVEGNHIAENTSTPDELAWSVKVVGGKITNTENNWWRKWDGIRDHKQIEGNDTPLNLLDNVFEITGSATGSNSHGYSWTSQIIDPLVRKLNCRWIGSGKVKVTVTSIENAAVLDFGNGACDTKASITYKNLVYDISLR